MFLKVSTQTRDGVVEPRLINVADIGIIKPAGSAQSPARTCITLRSQPQYPVWAVETMVDVESMVYHICDDYQAAALVGR